MIYTYPGIVREEENAYWVEFPDLVGCQTFAYTLDKSIEMAQEALLGYILTVLEDKEELNAPSEIKKIKVKKIVPLG